MIKKIGSHLDAATTTITLRRRTRILI